MPLDAPGAKLVLTAGEILVLTFASVGAGIAYQGLFLHTVGPIRLYLAVGLTAALLYGGAMHALDTTRRLRAPLSASAVGDVTLVWIAAVLMVTFLAFSLKTAAVLSRGAMLSYLVFGYAAILLTRAVLPSLIGAYWRPAQFYVSQALVIGAERSPATGEIVSELRGLGFPDPSVLELCTHCSNAEWHAELPAVIGRIYSLARTSGHGDICIAASGFSEMQLRDVIVALQVIPRAVRVIPDPAIEKLLHLPLRNVGKLYSVELQKAPMNGAQRFVKRAIDLVLSLPLLLFLAPLLAAIAVAIGFESRGPVLFRQKRLGYRGKPFTILKFRSMRVQEDGNDVHQAEKGDARVTGVGRFLRMTSLDELPQLFNVLKGEMSLVGPRPHAVAHDRFFSQLLDHYEVRQHVKPGISGWAQVNGLRGETASIDLMRERIAYDLQYAKNASLWFDTKILLLTVVEVLRRRNAY